MSYEPTNWKDGDLVTSAKLNKMEQGIANGGGILFCNEDSNGRLDKTWQEIYDAPICFVETVHNEDNHKIRAVSCVTYVAYNADLNPGEQYTLETDSETYKADSADSYPVGDGGR